MVGTSHGYISKGAAVYVHDLEFTCNPGSIKQHCWVN